MNDELITIIIPVYNVELYIDRCIKSVISQTHKNIECIFIDDCSPDNSTNIIKKYIDNYQGNINFRIIYHSRNKGLAAARNTGTLNAKGKYIYYLDSDDELTPICISTLLNIATKYPNAQIIQGNTQSVPLPMVCNDWRNIVYKEFPNYSEDSKWIVEHFFIWKNFIPVNAWNKLIKRDFIVNNNISFYEGIIHEDEQWIFLITNYIKAIAFCFDITYIHYETPNSIMTSKSNYRSIESWLKIIKIEYNKKIIFENELKTVYCISALCSNYAKIDPKTNEKELYPQYRQLMLYFLYKTIRLHYFKESLFLIYAYILPVNISKKMKRLLIRTSTYNKIAEWIM